MATRRVARIKQATPYGYSATPSLTLDDPDPDVIVSLTDAGTHMPVIDLDFPCQLLPSKTPGHFHWYIDKDMSGPDFEKLLKVMYEVGLVEHGYYQSLLRDGMTAVRFPYVKEWNGIKERLANGESIFDVEPMKTGA